MEKSYIISTVIFKNNTIENENEIFADLDTAKVFISDLFKYYTEISPKNYGVYDGYDGKLLYWFEIGDPAENYFIRCELQGKSIN